jgi:hypothetical protein
VKIEKYMENEGKYTKLQTGTSYAVAKLAFRFGV